MKFLDYQAESIGVFDIRRFGAVSDENASLSRQAANRVAIEAALAEVVARKGGKVMIPHGYWMTEPIKIPRIGDGYLQGWQPVEICGYNQPSMQFGTVGNVPMLNVGPLIRCLDNGSNLAAFYQEPSNTNTTNNPDHFTPTLLKMYNLEIRLYPNPTISGIDLTYSGQAIVRDVQITTGVYSPTAIQPTTASSTGLIMPATNNNALCEVHNVNVSGMMNGYRFYEHVESAMLNSNCNFNGIVMPATNHGIYIKRFDCQRNNRGIFFPSGPFVRFGIAQYNVEHASSAQVTPGVTDWQLTTADIYDPNNYGSGEINRIVTQGGSGASNTFTKTGGLYIKVKDEQGNPIP